MSQHKPLIGRAAMRDARQYARQGASPNPKKTAEHWFKRRRVLLYDTLAALVSWPLAVSIWALFWSTLDAYPLALGGKTLVVLILAAWILKLACFGVVGQFQGLWSYFSQADFQKILGSSSLASIGMAGVLWLAESPAVYYGILPCDWILTVSILSLGRGLYQRWHAQQYSSPQAGRAKKALILGAGEAGDQLARLLQHRNHPQVEIQGFLDDDPDLKGRSISGIKVLGTLAALNTIKSKWDISLCFIAMPSASQSRHKEIIQVCLDAGVEVKTLPPVRDIVDGQVSFSSLRTVHVEDLLGREPVTLNHKNLGAFLGGKVVLVTGGGGSIGSELCRQILAFEPLRLIIVDQCEYFLFRIQQELQQLQQEHKVGLRCAEINVYLGDVRNEVRVLEIMQKEIPQVVFHAAALKHVPLMESQAREAIQTNILGTEIVARAAALCKAESLILISTDKAVNPTNVMGASKRVAEMVCLQIAHETGLRVSILRFGNVLGSAGSVVPEFLQRIAQGKSLKVTHPEITRYFMTIPEAAQLVLEAGWMGGGGEIFVLDMGEPVKILRLAEDLIRLSGRKPYEDIPIEITGLRPGEKLFEELLADEEETLATCHPLVRIAKSRPLTQDFGVLLQDLKLKTIDPLTTNQQLKQHLEGLVPEYQACKS